MIMRGMTNAQIRARVAGIAATMLRIALCFTLAFGTTLWVQSRFAADALAAQDSGSSANGASNSASSGDRGKDDPVNSGQQDSQDPQEPQDPQDPPDPPDPQTAR